MTKAQEKAKEAFIRELVFTKENEKVIEQAYQDWLCGLTPKAIVIDDAIMLKGTK